MVFVCRGQPPFRVLLACGRSCCYGLSHFLQLTFPCWLIAVFAQSFRSFYFTTLLHSHRNANRTQELSFIRSLRSIPLISLSGYMSFPTLQIHVVAAVFRFTPHRFTTAHIHPYRSFASIHSIRSLLPALAFSNAPFGQKNAPNQLPAAPVHRAPRFLCPGHSLHSQRLAHNAQAEYFVPFLFTRISALLSTHAQGCFYYSV